MSRESDEYYEYRDDLYSRLEIRRCNDCDENFNIETVSWSTHSFTVVDNEFVRDRYYYQCPTHYGPQDPSMIFV